MGKAGGEFAARKELLGNQRVYKSLSKRQFLGMTNPCAPQSHLVRLDLRELVGQLP